MCFWIPLVILAAFFNALWVALSKRALVSIPADLFTVLFRAVTALFLLPLFIYRFQSPDNLVFWLSVALAGIFEGASIILQSIGVRRDYYATFSLANISPLFTLLLAPQLLNEKISPLLVLGIIIICAGVVVFFSLNWRFSVFGLTAALCSSLMNISSKVAIELTDPYYFSFLAFTIGLIFIIPFSPGVRKIREVRFNFSLIKLILLISIFSFLATIIYNIAIDYGPITRVSSLVRVNILFGFIISFGFLGERSHLKRRILGGILITVGSILVTQ
ncbi:EamA family transporter [Candidatus Sumerlaeota bacterium]|nr:EamA family transporter [Candidatus Sumerlaeota bacterium]